ncbi:MAG TPA: polyhydroxyalkanoate synthesis regulator DNA-binding domain-containing protein [Gemmatimonadales bacterium]|jgi:polyhydroxyalkanoate synthesis repressor PhaR
MVRIIKRYGGGSRKLYDTEESRYVSLREIAGWIRRGQELRVIDSRTREDVTAHTLAQVISADEERSGPLVSTELLHDIIRRGSAVVLSSVDRLIRLSTDRVGAVRDAREEMAVLRRGLKRLERSVSSLERRRPRSAARGTHSRTPENPGPDTRS